MKKYLIVLLVIVLILIGAGVVYSKLAKPTVTVPIQVACTMEAKLCPDGSAVADHRHLRDVLEAVVEFAGELKGIPRRLRRLLVRAHKLRSCSKILQPGWARLSDKYRRRLQPWFR